MSQVSKPVVGLLLLVGLTFLTGWERAPAAGTGGPQDRVRATLEAISAVLNAPGREGTDPEPERRRQVRQIILTAFDFQEMARISLRTYWEKLTSQQRDEFTGLFATLFERSYNRLVLRFLGERHTDYGMETIQQDRATVSTILVSKTDAKLPVDYQLVRHAEQWAIYDVVIDGVSLAMNYRAQFTKILRTSSYEALVQRIKAKLEEES